VAGRGDPEIADSADTCALWVFWIASRRAALAVAMTGIDLFSISLAIPIMAFLAFALIFSLIFAFTLIVSLRYGVTRLVTVFLLLKLMLPLHLSGISLP